MKRWRGLLVVGLLVGAAGLLNAQLPQLTCCMATGGGSGLAQGAGDTIADEEVIRGDASGLQGSNVYITDGDSPMVKYGGTTSSFPALKRNSTNIQFRRADDSGWSGLSSQALDLYAGTDVSSRRITLYAGGGGFDIVGIASDMQFEIGSSTTDSGAGDTGFGRVAAGISKWTDGDTGLGWNQWAGECFVASDQTNATTTPASTTCSITVKSGRKYMGACVFYLSDSEAAEGAAIDFDGGTATATNFRSHCTGFDAALAISAQTTALATDTAASTFTGAGMFECHIAFEPSANGTFLPRFMQVTHSAGTLTLARGSHCHLFDTP